MPDIKKTNLNKSISVKPQVFNTPLGVGEIGSSAKNAEKARIWAEGTDPEVETLGGEHSAKGWAEEAQKAVGGGTWGSITGTLSDQTDLQTALNAKMDKAGGTFTGDVTLGSGVNLKTANGRLHEVNNKLVLGDGSNNGLYVNPNGQTAALINGGTVKNIITNADVKSTYSSTGLDPVNGTAVASAISGIGITSNWYDNQSGATLATGLTISDPSKVVVFKNGNLLRAGQIISAKHFTGGSNHSVELTQTAPLSTADTWSVGMRFNWTPTAGTSPAIMNGAGTSDFQVPTITNDSGTGKILFLISSTGGSWNVVNGSSTNLPAPASGTVFDLKLSFTGEKYEMLYSTDYGKSWVVGQTNSTSTKTYCNTPFRFLFNKLSAGIDFNNSSTIYWEKTKIVIDGVTWFDGATATENTDYVNDGCTVTTVTSASNDYAIDTATGTIYFADNLVNDTITVLH